MKMSLYQDEKELHCNLFEDCLNIIMRFCCTCNFNISQVTMMEEASAINSSSEIISLRHKQKSKTSLFLLVINCDFLPCLDYALRISNNTVFKSSYLQTIKH